MATPPHIHLRNLNGSWVMDQELSSDTGPPLKLQGISLLVRKAIGYTKPIQETKMYHVSDGKGELTITRIEAIASSGGMLPSICETRDLTWEPIQHKDFLFGSVKLRTRRIRGSLDEDGHIRPDVVPLTKIPDPTIRKYLRGEICPQGNPGEGFLVEDVETIDLLPKRGEWIHTFDVHEDWTAEQVWGFESINCQRQLTKRYVVATRNGKFVLGRTVLSYVGNSTP